VLEALFQNGPLPVNTIGEMIDLTTGSITTAVDRMEAKWLVARRNHPDDRRIRIVELTAKGRKLVEKVHAQYSSGGCGQRTLAGRADHSHRFAAAAEYTKRDPHDTGKACPSLKAGWLTLYQGKHTCPDR
jgi:DNA-binding MarR family transcriptional regulator